MCVGLIKLMLEVDESFGQACSNEARVHPAWLELGWSGMLLQDA